MPHYCGTYVCTLEILGPCGEVALDLLGTVREPSMRLPREMHPRRPAVRSLSRSHEILNRPKGSNYHHGTYI